MKKTLFYLAALCLTPAFAAPLIGSKASLLSSTYCQQLSCELYNVQPLSSTLSQETYYFKPSGSTLRAESTVVYMLRDAGKVVSVGYGVTAQGGAFRDSSGFGNGSGSQLAPRYDKNAQAAELIKLATGTRPSNAWVIALSCPAQPKYAASTTRWRGLNRMYTVTCLSYLIDDYQWTQVRVY